MHLGRQDIQGQASMTLLSNNNGGSLCLLLPWDACCCLVAQSCLTLCDPSSRDWTAAGQASLSFTICQSFLKLTSIELMMPFNLLTLCCPFLLLPSILPCVCVCVCVSCFVESDSLQPHRLQPIRPLCPWDSPGKNNGMGCHFLLQKELEKGRKWSCSVVSDSLQPHGL